MDDQTFSLLIKSARISAGLTQEGCADVIGVPRRTIQNWESGLREPPPYVQRLVLAELERISNEKKGGQS